MKAIQAALAVGAAFFGCSAAAAKPPTAFVQCDGYAKPKPGSDNLVDSALAPLYTRSGRAG